MEIFRHAPAAWGRHPQLLFCAGSCGLFGFLWRRFGWEAARYIALASVPLAAVLAAWIAAEPGVHPHPFAHHAYIGWALAFGVHLWVLRAHEQRDEPVLEWLHAGIWFSGDTVGSSRQIDHYVEGRRVWPPSRGRSCRAR
jgi:hypothetical protein